MGNAANNAKTKWNAANYTQIKAYVAPDIAAEFKDKCATGNVSMNSVLSQFMVEYCEKQISKKPAKNTDFLSTSKKRRKKFDEILDQLKQIRDAQEHANENVHENFRNTDSFEDSEERVIRLDEAIEILDDIY